MRRIVGVVLGVTVVGALGACGGGGAAGTGGPTTAPAVADQNKIDKGVVGLSRSLAASVDTHNDDLNSMEAQLHPSPTPSAVAAAAAVVPLAGLKVCGAIPAAKVTPLVGSTVASGQPGGTLQSMCRWAAADGAYATVTVRPASAWAPLPGGGSANGVPGTTSVARVDGRWQATALEGPRVLVVVLAGPKASRTTTTALLSLAVAATTA